MTSKTVAQLLEDLGVARTHSRPHVSDDCPFIEAHFKTLKYCPAWPGHFGACQPFRADSFANHCVVVGSSFGSLIHTAVGSAGGWGGLRTKRSGWAA
jgi:hypothetical protein